MLSLTSQIKMVEENLPEPLGMPLREKSKYYSDGKKLSTMSKKIRAEHCS